MRNLENRIILSGYSSNIFNTDDAMVATITHTYLINDDNDNLAINDIGIYSEIDTIFINTDPSTYLLGFIDINTSYSLSDCELTLEKNETFGYTATVIAKFNIKDKKDARMTADLREFIDARLTTK